jgi:hypothetical protein
MANYQAAYQYCLENDFDPDTMIQEDTIEENKPVIIIESAKHAGRPATGKNAVKLTNIIRNGKRELKEYIDSGMDRTTIYNWYELIKEDCHKYSESNKTCKQIYFNFLTWWNKYDKMLFPDFY